RRQVDGVADRHRQEKHEEHHRRREEQVRGEQGAARAAPPLRVVRHDASENPDLRMSATVASCIARTASANGLPSCSALSKPSRKALYVTPTLGPKVKPRAPAEASAARCQKSGWLAK